MIEQMIQDTDPEQKELQARAYNALGDCYERAGRTKDALLAFLHVDVLYSTVPDAHAEALSHLVKLWECRRPGGAGSGSTSTAQRALRRQPLGEVILQRVRRIAAFPNCVIGTIASKKSLRRTDTSRSTFTSKSDRHRIESFAAGARS